jgi:hypothetical protein
VEHAQSFFFILFFVVMAGGGIWWTYSRSESMIDSWAIGEGFTLLERKLCWVVRGPFFWTTSKNQTVYRVTVGMRDGNIRSGWVRCGGWLLGLLEDRVEVRWD